MTIKRGVSLYSYQQSQFFKQLTLEEQIREVSKLGAVGIELIDEMSLQYPDPSAAFVGKWLDWMEKYKTVPVALDVGMDVLQFRDHVMTYRECADRLIHDIKLAHRLGFSNVRTLSVVPIEIIEMALPTAEELGIKLGKEIHQPMSLDGEEVNQILQLADKTGSEMVGIVPDLGIFQFQPSEVLLAWRERRGASVDASTACVELSQLLRDDAAPFAVVDIARHTAGNVRAEFGRFLKTGEATAEFQEAFAGVKAWTELHVGSPNEMDYGTVAEALMLSRTSLKSLEQLAPKITHIHGKFNNMSEVPGRPGEYYEATIDYPGVIEALQAGGFDGFINTEYEGQRYFQDRGLEDLQDEVEQVRRHQEMLARLIGE